MTLIWTPLIYLMVKIVCRIVSGCMDIADQVEEQHTIEIDLSSDSDEQIPVLA